MGKLKKLLKPLRKFKICYKNICALGYTGIETIRIIADMLYCRARFHCHIDEYINYDFMNRKDRDRKWFLLRYHQKGLFYKIVPAGKTVYEKKSQQYEEFFDFIGRDYIKLWECDFDKLRSFVEKQGKVVFKPNKGSHGRGIFIFNKDEGEEALLEAYLKTQSEDYICEGFIVQHPKMSEMASTVNTIRVITLNDHGKVSIVDTALRLGTDGKAIDNICNEGIGAAVDKETGIVVTQGADINRRSYMFHPTTAKQIIGFEIPMWDKVTELVTQAAQRIPHLPYNGWDVAIAENGPVIVELNNAPGPRLNQIIDQKPKGKEYIEYVKRNKKKSREISRGAKKIIRKYR